MLCPYLYFLAFSEFCPIFLTKCEIGLQNRWTPWKCQSLYTTEQKCPAQCMFVKTKWWNHGWIPVGGTGADPGFWKKRGGGPPMSAEGASFLGGPEVMPPRNFLRFKSLKWPFPALWDKLRTHLILIFASKLRFWKKNPKMGGDHRPPAPPRRGSKWLPLPPS